MFRRPDKETTLIKKIVKVHHGMSALIVALSGHCSPSVLIFHSIVCEARLNCCLASHMIYFPLRINTKIGLNSLASITCRMEFLWTGHSELLKTKLIY